MRTPTNATKLCLLLACASMAAASGCFENKPPSARAARRISFQHPVIPAVSAAALEAPPEIPFPTAAVVPALFIGHSSPAKPRAAQAPATDRERVEKSAEPTIAPELSAAELAAAQAQTQQNLDLAEKNLNLAAGRNLNAAQADLASKVRGFTDSAKEAMRSGDWARARNLSKKAVVLAEELAAGL